MRDLLDRGFPHRVAERSARDLDASTGRAVLALYRSAEQPAMAEYGAALDRAARRPGLAVIATADDAMGTGEQRRRSAARARATVHLLDGLGHWWMLEDPRQSAQMLASFWSGLPAS